MQLSVQADERLSLAQLLPELRDRAAEQGGKAVTLEGVSHRAVFNAALDGVIPAQRINGRWYVRRADLPRIAELLEAAVERKASRSRGHRVSSPNKTVPA